MGNLKKSNKSKRSKRKPSQFERRAKRAHKTATTLSTIENILAGALGDKLNFSFGHSRQINNSYGVDCVPGGFIALGYDLTKLTLADADKKNVLI